MVRLQGLPEETSNNGRLGIIMFPIPGFSGDRHIVALTDGENNREATGDKCVLAESCHMLLVCAACFAAPATKLCGECKVTAYCNKTCQIQDRTRHHDDRECRVHRSDRCIEKSPLHFAAIRNNLNVVKQELEEGADANESIAGFTPLLLAATAGHSEIVQFLAQQGADINQAPCDVTDLCHCSLRGCWKRSLGGGTVVSAARSRQEQSQLRWFESSYVGSRRRFLFSSAVSGTARGGQEPDQQCG